MSDYSMRETYDEMIEAINQIDVELDSLTGSTTGTKRAVITDLVTKHESVYSNPIEQIITNLESMDAEQQAAAYHAFSEALETNFGKAAKAYVDAKVDSMPTPEPMINEEEAAKRSEQRSALYQKVKAIVNLVSTVHDEEWAMPKMRRGSKGKRGKRNLSMFVFMIDGEEVDLTIGEIAKDNGYEKASELTKALRETTFVDEDGKEFKFNTTTGTQFDNFKLPNGKLLSGYRPDDDDDSDDSDEDED